MIVAYGSPGGTISHDRLSVPAVYQIVLTPPAKSGILIPVHRRNNSEKVMMSYTATKSRNAGRESWSVIFRHPARLDVATGKPGRRVRRGLGTVDEDEATRLISQLNEILRTEELWEPSSRATAAGRFDSRVIDIFYDGLEATRIDFPALRESLIPLPTTADGYRTVLLLGTTGAGRPPWCASCWD